MNYDPKENAYVAALEQLRSDVAASYSSWTLETVKHLALINIAGLAGATTLLQIDGWLHTLSVRLALILFFFGVILAVVDLHLNSLGYYTRLREIDRARVNTSMAATSEEVGRHGVPDMKIGKSLFVWAGAIGWVSAIVAIAGCLAIGVHLFGEY